MCLIKGREDKKCTHMTCERLSARPEALEHTKKSQFFKRADFNKVRLHRTAFQNPDYIRVVNPHKENSNQSTWQSFDTFSKALSLKAAGVWPKGHEFNRSEIDIQFFYYARRIGTYNPLTDDYDYKIVLDVEEAAVFIGLPF